MSSAGASGSVGRTGHRAADPVKVFRALADPARWAVLKRLCGAGELSRRDVEAALRTSKTMTSYHMKVLVHAGIMDEARSGRTLTYALRPETLAELETWLGDLRSAAPAGWDE